MTTLKYLDIEYSKVVIYGNRYPVDDELNGKDIDNYLQRKGNKGSLFDDTDSWS